MLIFKDIFSEDEVFTDAQKVEKDCECDDELVQVHCKEVKQVENTDFDIGANASQEEQCEQYEASVKTGIDVVLNQRLEEVTHLIPTAKEYGKYLKTYLKRVGRVMKANNEMSKGEAVLAAKKKLEKLIADHFDEFQFFTPAWKDEDTEPSEEEKPFIIPFRRCEETKTMTLYFFSHGIKEMKV